MIRSPMRSNALANVRRFEWDFSGAESEYKRAIELDPNNAGAHSNYAVHLLNFGRMTEALAEIKSKQLSAVE